MQNNHISEPAEPLGGNHSNSPVLAECQRLRNQDRQSVAAEAEGYTNWGADFPNFALKFRPLTLPVGASRCSTQTESGVYHQTDPLQFPW